MEAERGCMSVSVLARGLVAKLVAGSVNQTSMQRVGNEIFDAALASLLHVEGALVVIPLTHLRILSDGEPHPTAPCVVLFDIPTFFAGEQGPGSKVCEAARAWC
jgi:hypothetical protein